MQAGIRVFDILGYHHEENEVHHIPLRLGGGHAADSLQSSCECACSVLRLSHFSCNGVMGWFGHEDRRIGTVSRDDRAEKYGGFQGMGGGFLMRGWGVGVCLQNGREARQVSHVCICISRGKLIYCTPVTTPRRKRSDYLYPDQSCLLKWSLYSPTGGLPVDYLQATSTNHFGHDNLTIDE